MSEQVTNPYIPDVETGRSSSSILPQINIVEYSPEEFAKSLLEFYNALIEAGTEKTFAQQLTVAFCQRP